MIMQFIVAMHVFDAIAALIVVYFINIYRHTSSRQSAPTTVSLTLNSGN